MRHLEYPTTTTQNSGAEWKVRDGRSFKDVLVEPAKESGKAESLSDPKRVIADRATEGQRLWLARCAIEEVKTADLLPDLPFLLKEGGFLTITAKYVGGFRYLLECESAEALTRILHKGKETLSEWFKWIKPWHRQMESTPPGRLCWLSIRGVPCICGMKLISAKLQVFGERLLRSRTLLIFIPKFTLEGFVFLLGTLDGLMGWCV